MAGCSRRARDPPLRVEALELAPCLLLEDFDGCTLVKVPLRADGLVNFPHAAPADPSRDAPAVQMGTHGELIVSIAQRRARWLGEEVANRLRGSQEALDFLAHGGIGYRQVAPALPALRSR